MLDFDLPILIKGAGDVATGVAHRLYRAGFRPLMTELPQPLTVRRMVSFSEAVYAGRVEVEEVPAVRAAALDEALALRREGVVPVIVDPQGEIQRQWRPRVLIEATLAKHNTGITMGDAPLVIALGPGFTAGHDAHAVVETKRGHGLGRVITGGGAEPNTGEPEAVAGYTHQRVLRAPCPGVFTPLAAIGDTVAPGQVVGRVGEVPVTAAIAGVVRGLLHEGLSVTPGLKIGDIDPRGVPEYCFTISDKARAVGGGVLEAIGAFVSGR